MKIYVRHWMGKEPPIKHHSLCKESATFTHTFKEETHKPFTVKKGKNKGQTFKRKEYSVVRKSVTESLDFIEVNSLEELLELCNQNGGVLMLPPTDYFPYWSIIIDDDGKFTQR